ncbi:hypothetical protein SNEBB_009767 [Seison nebaliae]|nr:hypothetical protein SNEBB_009767 [Seison nebaliae]
MKDNQPTSLILNSPESQIQIGISINAKLNERLNITTTIPSKIDENLNNERTKNGLMIEYVIITEKFDVRRFGMFEIKMSICELVTNQFWLSTNIIVNEKIIEFPETHMEINCVNYKDVEGIKSLKMKFENENSKNYSFPNSTNIFQILIELLVETEENNLPKKIKHHYDIYQSYIKRAVPKLKLTNFLEYKENPNNVWNAYKEETVEVFFQLQFTFNKQFSLVNLNKMISQIIKQMFFSPNNLRLSTQLYTIPGTNSYIIRLDSRIEMHYLLQKIFLSLYHYRFSEKLKQRINDMTKIIKLSSFQNWLFDCIALQLRTNLYNKKVKLPLVFSFDNGMRMMSFSKSNNPEESVSKKKMMVIVGVVGGGILLVLLISIIANITHCTRDKSINNTKNKNERLWRKKKSRKNHSSDDHEKHGKVAKGEKEINEHGFYKKKHRKRSQHKLNPKEWSKKKVEAIGKLPQFNNIKSPPSQISLSYSDSTRRIT